MNIPFQVARLSRRMPTVERCVARHDGGYLVRLTDGHAGVSPVALPVGSRAQLTQDSVAEVVR